MLNMLKSLVEEAESESIINIDPKEKSYNKETDNLLYNEAYEKAVIWLNTGYKKYKEYFDEIVLNINFDIQKLYTKIYTPRLVEIHSMCINPNINISYFRALSELDSIPDKFDNNECPIKKFKELLMKEFTDQELEKRELLDFYLGKVVQVNVPSEIIIPNLRDIVKNIQNLKDDIYFTYKLICKDIEETKDPEIVEKYVIIYNYILKNAGLLVSAYLQSSMELMQLYNKPILTESVDNEENVKEYIEQIGKLIDEIRDYYDKFKYKEMITPRKKKEPKMYEYILGALNRKYTLKIPIYKVEGSTKEVKDIVEKQFIDKLESITKKYPNFIIMSPSWDDESDMFIYITLREPFGEKEDKKDREDQINKKESINESALSAKDRKEIPDSEFGIPKKRKYPLNDRTRIESAIQMFRNADPSDKRTLAENIVRRIIELDLVGKVNITEKNPFKKYFPDWMINTVNPKLVRDGNIYDIYVNDVKVDYGTLQESNNDINESIFSYDGKLY